MDARRGLRYTVVSLGAVALGGGLALLASGGAWMTVHVDRPAPLPVMSVGLTGRTLQAAVPGLAVVALAGVVALLATRGVARRIVGAVIALAGVALAVAAGEAGSVSSDEARRQLADTRTGMVLPASGESDLALWQRLDLGDDPTARTQS